MSELEDIKVTLRKLNHFSEAMIEWKDDMNVWKGGVSADIRWTKWLMGGTFLVLAAAFVKDLLGG